jgi:hypothetical protein
MYKVEHIELKNIQKQPLPDNISAEHSEASLDDVLERLTTGPKLNQLEKKKKKLEIISQTAKVLVEKQSNVQSMEAAIAVEKQRVEELLQRLDNPNRKTYTVPSEPIIIPLEKYSIDPSFAQENISEHVFSVDELQSIPEHLSIVESDPRAIEEIESEPKLAEDYESEAFEKLSVSAWSAYESNGMLLTLYSQK